MPQPTHQSSPRQPVTDRRFKRFADRVTGQLKRLYKRLRGLEATVDPLVDHVGHAEEELHELEERVERLENTGQGSMR
jgi:hypothetical protein